MIRSCFASVLAVGLCSISLADFKPTPKPVAPDGTAAIVDLPTSQHMRNIGGSDGAGLCVFTSIEHSARWQCVNQLDGFQKWMSKRPGGGWPEKVDEMIAEYAREQGVSAPTYIQHTGGDVAFLELALHTDRMPGVTYAGRDDFYRGRIAHMVSLAHLDSQRAAIIDNNRPGYWVWMTRAEFLQRWRDMQGGWAVVLLNPPPPPHLPASSPQVAGNGTGCDCCKPTCTCYPPSRKDKGCACYPCKCGQTAAKACSCTSGECKCKEGTCPNKCPVTRPKFEQLPSWGTGGCGNGRCQPIQPSDSGVMVVDPYPAFLARIRGGLAGALFVGVPDRMRDSTSGTPHCAVPSGYGGLANGEYLCQLKDGMPWVFPGMIPQGMPQRIEAAPAPRVGSDNFGVDCTRIHTHPAYSINGHAVSREDAHAALAGGSPLADDSACWHLTAVGDAAFLAKFKADVSSLSADVRAKLLVQAYTPDRWEVSAFALPVGVNLRKPSPVRTAADVGSVLVGDYTAAKLNALLAMKDGPAPAPPEPPKPAPSPAPSPIDPSKPAPAPAPAPAQVPLWALGLGAFLLWYFSKKK